MMRNQPYTHEVKSFSSSRSWPITDYQYNDIKAKIAAGKKMIEMPDGSILQVSAMTIERRQLTMADFVEPKKQLPEGERKVDVNGPGFKAFVKSAKKLNPAYYRRKMAEWGLDAETGEVIKKGDDNGKQEE